MVHGTFVGEGFGRRRYRVFLVGYFVLELIRKGILGSICVYLGVFLRGIMVGCTIFG